MGEHWTARHGKPIIFVILTLVAVGVYLASTIPVAVFPEVDFPRILVGVDNGVAPIDQMLVTVTRPIDSSSVGIVIEVCSSFAGSGFTSNSGSCPPCTTMVETPVIRFSRGLRS